MKYLMKVKGFNWWKSEHGEATNKKQAKLFDKKEADAINKRYNGRYELIEVKE